MKSRQSVLRTVPLLAVLTAWMALSSPAAAIDAGDVMDKMEPRERHGFVGGAVDMASHLYAVDGNREKADCAVNWFFREEGSLSEVYSFYDAHKDKDAVGLLAILINRHCGE